MLLAGCGAPRTETDGPSVLRIQPASYEAAFETAVGVARDSGYITAVRDREAGVIETQPQRIGTVLEPWIGGSPDPQVALEATLSTQRRRLRFEFVPTDFAPATVDPAQPLEGPAVLAPGIDVARDLAPLELRVWASIERIHVPGQRRSDWTRRVRSIATDPPEPVDPAETVVAQGYWTPIGRDAALERELLAEVEKRLVAGGAMAPTRGEG